MSLHIGQRVDVFEAINIFTLPKTLFTPGKWYAERANDKYNGNPYGRNMVADYKPQWGIPHLNINSGDMSTGQMRKVGTLVVTKIKGV